MPATIDDLKKSIDNLAKENKKPTITSKNDFVNQEKPIEKVVEGVAKTNKLLENMQSETQKVRGGKGLIGGMLNSVITGILANPVALAGSLLIGGGLLAGTVFKKPLLAIKDKLLNSVEDVWTDVKTKVFDIKNNIISSVNDAINTIKDKIDEIGDKAKNLGKKALDLPAKGIEAVKESTEKATKGIKKLWDKTLGFVTKQSESAGGKKTISKGKDDIVGGASYGVYQLSSKKGTVEDFLKSVNLWEDNFSKLKIGSNEFNKKWKEMEKILGKEFEDMQKQFMLKTHFEPTAGKLEKRFPTMDVKGSKALQELIFSTSTQFGSSGAVRLFERALNKLNINELTSEAVINAVTKEKMKRNEEGKLSYFKSSKEKLYPGLIKRFEQEQKTFLAIEQKQKREQLALRSKEQVILPIEKKRETDQLNTQMETNKKLDELIKETKKTQDIIEKQKSKAPNVSVAGNAYE